CDFAFELDPTVTRDDGDGACPYYEWFSLYDNIAFFGEPAILAFASKIPKGHYTPYGPYYDTLLVGYDFVTPKGEYGPFLRRMTGGTPYDFGTASLDGDELEWS